MLTLCRQTDGRTNNGKTIIAPILSMRGGIKIKLFQTGFAFFGVNIILTAFILSRQFAHLCIFFLAFSKPALTLLVVRSGGRGLGNLFTAVVNPVGPSQRLGATRFTTAVNKFSGGRGLGNDSPQPWTSFQVPCHLTLQRIYYTAKFYHFKAC